jgi:hypothetical protein
MNLSSRALRATAIGAVLACAAFAAQAQGPQAAPQSAAQPAAVQAPPQNVRTAAQFVGDYKPPRNKSGKPDFQGVWTNASVSRMERPSGYPLIISRAEADKLEGRSLFNVRLKTEKSFVDPNAPAPEKGKALPGVGNYDVAYTDPGAAVANIKGELRSSYLTFPADGHIPAMTDQGKALRAELGGRRRGTGYDNPEERGLSERCVLIGTGGPPLGNYLYNNNFQIVQTNNAFVLEAEMIHDTRIAPIGGEHRKDSVEPWMGDSVAHWDGDTLVVETTHINAAQRAGGTFLSKDGKVTERFTRISDDEILYEFEINDPSVYTSTWGGQMPLYKSAGVPRLFEYACHEGNYAMEHILAGGRRNDTLGIVNKTDGNRGE